MKKVLVQVCDKNYLNHAKSLFVNSKLQGKWKGDFCLIANNIDQKDLEDFKNTDIKIINVNNLNYYYATLHVFSSYFKQWDVVLYMDSDIVILDDIENENFPPYNTLYMDKEPFQIQQYFCKNWNESEKNIKLQKLKTSYPFIEKNGYNAGCIYFNTSVINDGTLDNLFEVQKELNEINNHAGIGSDQPIINLYFYKNIESKLFCEFWRTKNNVKALHFCHEEAPWVNTTYSQILKKSYRDLYIENLNLFTSVMVKEQK